MTDLSQVPGPHNESKFVTFEDLPFQLCQPYPPAGGRPEAIRQLVESIEDGLSYQTLLGTAGSGKTFTMVNVIVQVRRPAIAFAPSKTLAAQLYSELREFFPRNTVEYFVSCCDYYRPEAYVPQRDLFIEKDSSINEHIKQVRLSVTKSLLERRDVVIVATVSTIYGIGNPSEYHQIILTLRTGDKVSQHDMVAHLVTIRYIHNETGFQRGTFRVHGDTVDTFPAGRAEVAVRLGLFSGEVESLQLFDPLTGRVWQEIPRFTVYPSSHYVTPRETVLRAIKTIKAELHEWLGFFYKGNKLMEAQRLEQRMRFDLEMLQELDFYEGIENCSWHLSGSASSESPPTLVDYLPPDALMFLDKSHVLIGQFNGMYNGDRAHRETLAEYSFRLPSALGNRPLKFAEFKTKVWQVTFVPTTSGDYKKKATGTEVVEQVVRPTNLVDPIIEVRPVTTQVDDLLSEIHVCVEAGGRVLVATLTGHVAEQLTEFLPENDVKVRYLHSDIDTVGRVEIIRGLRLGTFDVLVGISLLREGLDIPEVSLVTIPGADKEGFLRVERSLIQAISCAARSVNGTVVPCTDRMTDSMKKTIDEAERRHAKQVAHNKAHGITPRGIVKRIKDIIDGTYDVDDARVGLKAAREVAKYEDMNEKQAPKEIKRLEEQMLGHTKNLEFEKAAAVRDQLTKPRSRLFRASGEDHIVPAA